LNSFRFLLDVALLLLVLFVFFATLGLQIFNGKLHQRCMNVTSGEFDLNGDRLCSLDGSSRTCLEGFICVSNATDPNYGFTTFDNVGYSILTLLGASSTDSWAFVMYYVRYVLAFPNLFDPFLRLILLPNSFRTPYRLPSGFTGFHSSFC
jgi:hypothetical protein